MERRPRRILPVIVASQFAATSLWFAGNAVIDDLQRDFDLGSEAIGPLTSAVQLGFIAGTLVFAVLAISDRFSPRRVFFGSALAGAAANLALLALDGGLVALLVLRFATGFFLAGVYPVGMRIAAGWYREGLGNAIGWLVAALVLGTALPHLLAGVAALADWRSVTAAVSAIAAAGGLLMYALVPDGPVLARGSRFEPAAIVAAFASSRFRASAGGYFGHMWELYAFWAFVPVALAAHAAMRDDALAISLWSFAIIAAGSIGCAVGGLVSLRAGSARVAFAQLAASGLCCLASPLLFFAPTPLYLAFLAFWGVVVVGDSPQFSALNATNAPRDRVGSALTIVNSIGFAITIPSLQLLHTLAAAIPPQWLFFPLALGPAVGLLAMSPLVRARNASAI